MAINQRGKKWGYDFRYDGERYRSHKWHSQREAEDAELEMRMQLKKGINLSHEMSFQDYFEQWADVKTHGLTDRTIENYRYSHLVLKNYFKTRKIKDIKRIEYQKFIKWFGLEAPNSKSGGKGMSQETVDKVHGHIAHAVRDAVYEGLIVKDFTYEVDKHYTDNSVPVEDKFISIAEFKEIKRRAKEDTTLTSIGIFISAITAARYSDFKHIRYEDIDVFNSSIHLPGTKTKTSDRILKVNQQDLVALQNKIDKFPRNLNGFIFHNGKSFIRGESFNDRINHLVRDMGVRRLTIYVLRHTLGSIFLSDGLSEDFVYKFLGHTSAEQLRKTYRHQLKEKQDIEVNESMKISGKL